VISFMCLVRFFSELEGFLMSSSFKFPKKDLSLGHKVQIFQHGCARFWTSGFYLKCWWDIYILVSA
jgi:hypothetical protein